MIRACTLLLAACPAPDDSATAGSTGEPVTTTGSTAEPPTTGDATSEPTTDETTSEPTTGGPAVADERFFYVPGRMGDQAFILRVSPATGAIDPYGPALPIAAAELSHPVIVARPDHSQVVVQAYVQPEVPVATLLVGDGAGWSVVTKYNKFGLGGNALAADASLFWFDEMTDPDVDPTFQAIVLRPGGDVVFTGAPLSGDDRIDAFTFGPGGDWFTFRDPVRGRVLRTVAGAEAELPGPFLELSFPTSVVVSDGAALLWTDTAGVPLVVPGFSGIPEDVSDQGYQVVAGELSRLGDRVVTPLQKVPAELRASDVYRHFDGFVIGRLGGAYTTIGPDAASIDAFALAPSPNEPEFGEIETALFPLAECGGCSTRSVAFSARNSILDGDVGFDADASVQLWRLDAGGAALGQSLISPWKESPWGPRGLTYSADGAFLAWTEEGEVRRLDVAADVVETLASPFELIGP